MMLRNVTRYGALLLGLSLAVGCQTLGSKRKDVVFDDTARQYEATMRWGDLHRLYGFYRPEKADKAEVPDGLDNIRVTGYDITSPPADSGERGRSQVALVRYVERDRQVEKTVVDRQLWEYDEENERWYLISDVPEFSLPKIRRMPLE